MRIKQLGLWALILIGIIVCLDGCNSQPVNSDIPYHDSLFEYNISVGEVDCSVDDYLNITDGETVTLTAKARQGYYFAGWTKGAYLESYGEIVSENEEYTFTKSNEKYFANFIRDGEVFVCYYSNGGEINHSEAKDNCFIQKVKLGEHLYPTTIPQNGTFIREGFVLKEYSANPDGTGIITNIGQRAFYDSKIIQLYAQWSPETDTNKFTFSNINDGVYITCYIGEDEILTIPTKYNGQDVIGIAEGAITSKTVKTVVIPETVKVVKEAAFKDCSSLKTVYIYDTVTEMNDDSFTGCPITTVCLNSVYEQKYYAEGCGKLELLFSQKNGTDNRIVVLSGSSGIFGLDAKLLQSLLNRDFKVVNFGLQVAIPATFSMKIMNSFLHSGDIVLLAPECEFKQFGNTLSTNAFIKYDGVYTAMRNVDVREYSSFFTALSLYSMAKISATNLYNETDQFFYENGDLPHSCVYEPFAPTYVFKSPTEREEMTPEVYKAFNDSIHELNENEVKVYLSFAPFCTEACKDEVTANDLDAYSKSLADNLDVICISTQSSHDYPMEFFFEMFHMTAEGKQIRTEKLSQELNAQFDKEN